LKISIRQKKNKSMSKDGVTEEEKRKEKRLTYLSFTLLDAAYFRSGLQYLVIHFLIQISLITLYRRFQG
jgi:hypothetical protein